MESFFQLSEHVRRQRILHEDQNQVQQAEPRQAQDNMAQQNNSQQAAQQQQKQQPQTNAPEMSDADLVTGLQTNWDRFVRTNTAAIQKLGQIDAAKDLATAVNEMPGKIKQVVAALQQNTNKAGSNMTGSSAGKAPPAAGKSVQPTTAVPSTTATGAGAAGNATPV
jgi:hypothetical protein